MAKEDIEIRRMRRLLRETARIAEHASLTGSLEKGSRLAIRQYNAIIRHLQDNGTVPDDLFPELDEQECPFDELGVAARLLEGYLEDDDDEASGESEREKEGKRKRVEIKFNTGGTQDLHSLAEIIRASLPEIVREHLRYPGPPEPPTPPTPPTPPVAPTPPTRPTPPAWSHGEDANEMRTLVDMLRGELSESERAEIAARIVQLAQSGR